MKKIYVLLFIFLAIGLQFCATKKNMVSKSKTTVNKVTYLANVQPIMTSYCSPCHMPPQGKKKPYDTFTAVKEDVNDIINRVQRNPGERGFMPQKHPKLSDSTVNILKKWKDDGLVEK